MEMLAKYEGRIVDGKPMFLEEVLLQENTNITILVDLSFSDRKEKFTPAQKAASQFLSAIENINKEGFSAEDEEVFDNWDRGEYKLLFDRRLDV
jgi:hypothetical protein